MPTFTATVAVSNGTLSVVRPHPAPEGVNGAIDSLLYRVVDTDSPSGITSVGVTFVTDDTAPPAAPVPAEEIPGTSGTPIGDAAEAAAAQQSIPDAASSGKQRG